MEAKIFWNKKLFAGMNPPQPAHPYCSFFFSAGKERDTRKNAILIVWHYFIVYFGINTSDLASSPTAVRICKYSFFFCISLFFCFFFIYFAITFFSYFNYG